MWRRISQKRVRTLVIAVLAFYEFGTFHVQREEYRQLPWLLCVWELRIYILIYCILFQNKWATSLFDKRRSSSSSWDRDSDSFCPLVWPDPADLSNQEKKSDAGRKEGADKRKADQKVRKAKGKAKPGLAGYLLGIFHQDWWQFHWSQLLLCRLSFAGSEMNWLCSYHQVS